MILDLWGTGFHAVVVFGLGKNLLLNSILGRCANLVNVVCERPLIVKWAHSVYKATFPILSHSGNALDSMGAAGARTCRSLGHHLLPPLILRPRTLNFYSKDCTRRSK